MRVFRPLDRYRDDVVVAQDLERSFSATRALGNEDDRVAALPGDTEIRNPVADAAAELHGRLAPHLADFVRVVGVLYLGIETEATASAAALRQGLVERGYAEERDFRLEIRFGNNDASQLKALVKDLLAHGAKVIVTAGTTSARAGSRTLASPRRTASGSMLHPWRVSSSITATATAALAA